MAIDQKLQIKQGQQMVLTPQMQQSIKILQLPVADLINYVHEEMEQNPFLEPDEINPDGNDNSAEVSDNTHETNADSASQTLVETSSESDPWSDDSVSGAVYEPENADLTYSNVSNSDYSSAGGGDNYLEQIEDNAVSLRDHIIDQIHVDITNNKQRMIAIHLTDYLDQGGYYIGNDKEISENLKCTAKDISEVLQILQSFEPSGVFASSLEECLSIQLKEKDRFDPAMERFVAHLDLMAKHDFKRLSRICRVNLEDIEEMCHEIRELNPKPGAEFVHEVVEEVLPDVYLKKNGNQWHLELNNDVLPKVLVNRTYHASVKKHLHDKSEKQFLTDQLNTANWLVKALDQRANTILKVASEIVDQQSAFFESGIAHLKPLVLGDIANAIEMHESTISRVVNGKFIATHMGLFELKYFFSSHVAGTTGEGDVSSTAVKYKIKQLIDNEDPKKILSDEKIASLLKDDGISVARRTVMKYREAMNLGSSVQRRREKALK